MDPNETLRRIRELAAMLLDPEQVDGAEHAQQLGEELAEKTQALDEWVAKGGFLPLAWAEGQAS